MTTFLFKVKSVTFFSDLKLAKSHCKFLYWHQISGNISYALWYRIFQSVSVYLFLLVLNDCCNSNLFFYPYSSGPYSSPVSPWICAFLFGKAAMPFLWRVYWLVLHFFTLKRLKLPNFYIIEYNWYVWSMFLRHRWHKKRVNFLILIISTFLETNITHKLIFHVVSKITQLKYINLIY